MLKLIQNTTYEVVALAMFLFLAAFNYLIGIGYVPSGILLTILGLYYLIKMILSFRNWKKSKLASVINAHINFMLFVCISGVGFILLSLPGGSELIHSSLVIPQLTVPLFGVIALIRWKKVPFYWTLIKANILKWIVGITLCLVFFYVFDIPSYLIRNGQEPIGWIPLY